MQDTGTLGKGQKQVDTAVLQHNLAAGQTGWPCLQLHTLNVVLPVFVLAVSVYCPSIRMLRRLLAPGALHMLLAYQVCIVHARTTCACGHNTPIQGKVQCHLHSSNINTLALPAAKLLEHLIEAGYPFKM